MPKRTPASTARLLPTWKKALFAGLATLLFFATVEGTLTLLGVRPILFDEDPHVGFSSNIPLFVEGREGRMTTAPNKVRWFNEQSFSRRKPSATTRVFCLGGSTTYGRPYDDATSFCGWLREYLPAADPSTTWEVINAGGISYASYRVAKLMEELVDYEPDLFIVYSGHNEFLEDRTYAGIISTPAAVRGMQSALGHTRTYSFLTSLLRRKAASLPAETPVLAGEVATILDQSAGLERYRRDPVRSEKVVAHYRFNLSRMVDIAEAAGAGIVFVTPAANVRSASPFKSEHSVPETAAWKTAQNLAEEHVSAQRYDEALSAIDQALGMDPGYAHSHFMRAEVLESLGKFDEAMLSYQAALENDVCPLRILPNMRTILKETVSSRNVPLFDFHDFLSKQSAHGLPGDDWFLDHVHPTVEGHRRLALELVSLMEQRGMLSNKSALTAAAAEQIRNRVLDGIDANAHGIALRNLGNVLNWAGKKREAYAAATKALALAPGDAYAHYLAGDLAGDLGKPEEAEAQFRELTRFNLDPNDAPYFPDAHYQLAEIVGARGDTGESIKLLSKTLQLKPDHQGALEALPLVLEAHGKRLLQAAQFADAATVFRQLESRVPGHPRATNLLGVALIQDKQFPEAIQALNRVLGQDDRNPTVHNNLGSAYAQSSQPADAERHFRKAIHYHPKHAGAHLNLAKLLESSARGDEAAKHFATVVELDPTSAEAKAGLARTTR